MCGGVLRGIGREEEKIGRGVDGGEGGQRMVFHSCSTSTVSQQPPFYFPLPILLSSFPLPPSLSSPLSPTNDTQTN